MRWYHLTGKKFSMLTVIGPGKSKKVIDKNGISSGTRKYWECECECGNITQVISSSLISGKTRSCGCFVSISLKKRTRELSPNWKGGYHIKEGYKFILDKNHPNKNNIGYVSEHVHVMSNHLGRGMIKGESVHHKNGNKLDNRIENLELWSHSHPCGQRIEDKIKWCIEFLSIYAPQKLTQNTISITA